MSRYIPKGEWPLRTIVERRQDFRSSEIHPDGYIAETLECGHQYVNDISTTSDSHRTQAIRRRCIKCAVEHRQARRAPTGDAR